MDTPDPRGIFASDLIIITAIRKGLDEIRQNPWVLDYIFQNLTDDSLTAREYGQKQVDLAKKWLTKTDFSVSTNTLLEDMRLPGFSVSLVESVESDNTLGDKHYEVYETAKNYWPPVVDYVVPVSRSAANSSVTLPATVTVDLFPGMLVFDSSGTQFPIQDVQLDSLGRMVLTLPAGAPGDFSRVQVRSALPPSVELEGAEFRETYLIGAHVQGEPLHLVILHSALVFTLLRHRQDLLEARGFQVSTIGSTDFAKRPEFEGNTVWSRYVNLTGKVRHVWPKARVERVGGVEVGFEVINGGTPVENPSQTMWGGDGTFPDLTDPTEEAED